VLHVLSIHSPWFNDLNNSWYRVLLTTQFPAASSHRRPFPSKWFPSLSFPQKHSVFIIFSVKDEVS
jgi:hypothetical protein